MLVSLYEIFFFPRVGITSGYFLQNAKVTLLGSHGKLQLTLNTYTEHLQPALSSFTTSNTDFGLMIYQLLIKAILRGGHIASYQSRKEEFYLRTCYEVFE